MASQLYTIYRKENDELICFELTAEKCAEFLGVTVNRFYGIAMKGTKEYYVIKTCERGVKENGKMS